MAARKNTSRELKTTAYTHDDTRANNPTADARDLITEEVEQVKTLLYPRDPSLDPQLVWKGKDEQDWKDLEVPAPPIFRQEQIEPKYLVKQLVDETRKRHNGETPEADGDPALFGLEAFDDGIEDELDKVDWYHHQMRWSNRMILGDSLHVMGSLAERENLRGKVQMVYIDPPYGIKFGSNWQSRADVVRVRDGKMEDATREVEQIKAFRDTWDLGIHSYLAYLRDRLVTARELLTESGSVFLQIGDENIHLVRSLLDEVFGSENFVSLITFKTTSGAGSFAGGTNVLAAVNNYILWYARDLNLVKYRALFRTKSLGGAGGGQYTWAEDEAGNRSRLGGREPKETERAFRPDQLTSQTTRVGQTTVFPIEVDGESYLPSKGGWKTNLQGMTRLRNANRLMPVGKTLTYVRYLDDFPAFPYTNLWDDTVTSGFADPKTYVVQTNTKVVERCMLMATDPGDLVLDPTCGSGTTAYVAEQWARRWITIDTSRVAIALARHRIMGAKFPAYLLADSEEGKKKEAELLKREPDRSRSNRDIRKGFVCERVPHITLKSIANNPDIVEGMSREEIERAIQRHAPYETLYDRPYEDKKTVRLAGPFTVESLSPHRSIAPDAHRPASEKAAEMSPSGGSYIDTILEHVKKAGVQNGFRKERLEFESIEPVAGRVLTAVGIRKDAEEGTPQRVGIAVGPEYGAVDQMFIKHAAREALNDPKKIDLLLILGFAFDSNANEAKDEINQERGEFAVVQHRNVGKMTVLNVRMNPDLAMGDELANTGAGNLFTVFGEPDISVTETEDGRLVAAILGLDIYNPTTGEIRSEGPEDIMMWSVDTDYDAEAFRVRHVYFSGKDGKPNGLNPYERLAKTLKAEIDAEALATLFSTTSRPFPKPEGGQIAVKVVNYYGDEVLKVIEV